MQFKEYRREVSYRRNPRGLGQPRYHTKSLNNRDDNMVACVVLERKENDVWIIITVMHNFKEI